VREIHVKKGDCFCGFFERNCKKLTTVFRRSFREQTALPAVFVEIFPRGSGVNPDLRGENSGIGGYFAIGPDEHIVSGETIAL
jgi:hypothetical protein